MAASPAEVDFGRRASGQCLSPLVGGNLSASYCFGGVLAGLWGGQAISGGVIALHYLPSSVAAFDSLGLLTAQVEVGVDVRGLHCGLASCLMAAIGLHLARSVGLGSTLRSHLALWLSGYSLLGLGCMVSFLGYVLPWGQMSFWALTVISNLSCVCPVLGGDLLR